MSTITSRSNLSATSARCGDIASADLLTIRPATSRDRDYLHRVFNEALGPFYGGDHTAHAERLLRTHLAGGVDRRGLLSVRQLLFILLVDGDRAGVLNLVIKRQSTCKISPLILDLDHRERGFGARLMEIAEEKALSLGARQLYCTVTEKNHEALTFFRTLGFVTCGYSDDQYKDGQREILLRRSLAPVVELEGPASVISVAEILEDEAWFPVRDLLLRHMRPQVDGANEAWLRALRSGTGNAPCGRDEHATWVFAAQDRLGCYRAGAIATRKKGDSVKIMPLAADDVDAFRALVVDLPSLLHDKGRKAYLHIVPETVEVAILQETGWDFEALMPGAYNADMVTQQWACALGGQARSRSLRIRREYYDLIRSGRKTLEVRVGYPNIKAIRPGDELKLVCGPQQTVCRVRDVRTYPDFAATFETEDVDKALPGMQAEEAIRVMRTIYPPERENRGVVVLELCLADT